MSYDDPGLADQKPSLRLDARRNLDKLRNAAASAFNRSGLGVPLEEIARQAGVSTGTLYNRFGGREALIDEVFSEVLEDRLTTAVDRAEQESSPWQKFERYVWELGSLQAANPALNDLISQRYPGAQKLAAVCERGMSHARRFISEAQVAGSLRSDFGVDDLFLILWTNAALLRATTGEASGVWCRRMSMSIDGLRAPVSRPLPAGDPLAMAAVNQLLQQK